MAEDYVQNLDIYKYGRTEEMQSFNFETNGDVELVHDNPDLAPNLEELGLSLKKNRLLPSLTLFFGRNSPSYKQEIQQFMIYCLKEVRKYKEIETQRENNKEMYIETMGGLNFDNDFNITLPDMSQLSQVVNASTGNIFDQEGFLGFDQPIEGQSQMKYEGPLLEELNETLRQGNPAADDLAYRDEGFDMNLGGTGVKYETVDYGNYEDYGDIESNMRRNPDDYVTPTNIFMRAARQLNSVKSNMKAYNMKRDLKLSNFSSGVEYFGPDSIQVKKEKLPKIKRIIDARNASAVKKVKPTSAVDFSIPTQDTFSDDFLAELLIDKKKSRTRNFDKDDPEDFKYLNTLPPEEIIVLDDFNSLFTRNIKEFNLEEELALNAESRSPVVRPTNGDPEGAYGASDFEADGGPEGMPVQMDDGYMNDGGQEFEDLGEGMDAEQPLPTEQSDMTGMNLFTNYFNIKEDDKILSLEKKLAQNFNFKITEFKRHVNERYVQLLENVNNVSYNL